MSPSHPIMNKKRKRNERSKSRKPKISLQAFLNDDLDLANAPTCSSAPSGAHSWWNSTLYTKPAAGHLGVHITTTTPSILYTSESSSASPNLERRRKIFKWKSPKKEQDDDVVVKDDPIIKLYSSDQKQKQLKTKKVSSSIYENNQDEKHPFFCAGFTISPHPSRRQEEKNNNCI